MKMALSAKTQQALKQVAETPEALAADKIWRRIEDKLNYDQRFHALGMAESMLRIGRLSNVESEFLAKVKGWDAPYYGGIDWDEVPSAFIAACLELPEKRIFNVLSYCHPAPERKPIFDVAESFPELVENFLSGELTFDELKTEVGA
jgi:hypothetical protein